MAASGKKKGKLKGKTLNLNEFLSNDSGGGGGGGGSQYVYKPVNSWADETDDLENDGGSSWLDSDVYSKPAIDRSKLPTAPRSSRPVDVDHSRLPSGPPYTAFLGNLPYDCEKEDIFSFFKGLKISEVRLPRDGGGEDGRLKGFGYAEFDDVQSLIDALALNNENLKNRRLRVDIAGQSQDGGRDRDHRDQGPDRTDSDWRRPPDDPPPSSREDRYRDIREYGDRGNDRYGRGGYDQDRDQDRYGSRNRGYSDQGYDDRRDSGRRSFGSGYRNDDRQDYDRGGGYSRGYERRDRYDRDSDRDRYGSRDDYQERDQPRERKKLQLQPRTQPIEQNKSPPPAAQKTSSSIFGGAKPVDTAAREREIEERILKEKQLEEERAQSEKQEYVKKDSWRDGRQRRDSDRSNDGWDGASRTRHSSSGSASGRGGPKPVMRSRKDSDHSDHSDTVFKEENEREVDPPKPAEEPKKIIPAPPPKENPWTKRSVPAETKQAPVQNTESKQPPQKSPPKESSPPQAPQQSRKDYVDAPPPKENVWARRAASTAQSSTHTERRQETSNRSAGRGRGSGDRNRPDDRRPDTRRRNQDQTDRRKEDKRERKNSEPKEMPKYEEPKPQAWGQQSKFSALLDDDADADNDEIANDSD